MQLIRGDYFIKRDFAFYDSCALAVLGPTVFNIYEVLRRFVWRDENTGHSKVRKHLKQGLLVARVRQRTIGEYLGLKLRSINQAFRRMKDLGWVVKIEEGAANGEASIFQLGEVIHDSSGCKHEAFFADAWMQMLWDYMAKEAKKSFKGVEGFEEEVSEDDILGDQEPNEVVDVVGRKCIRATSPHDRVVMVTAFLLSRGMDVRQETQDEGDCVGVRSGLLGGTHPNAQGGEGGYALECVHGIENHTPSECGDLKEDEDENPDGVAQPAPRAAAPHPADPGPSPTPLLPKAVETSADDVGACVESSDKSDGVHVDVVPFPQATRDFVTRLRERNAAKQRQDGEVGLRQARSTEEKLKNLKGRDGKLSRKVLAELEALWTKGFATLFPGLKFVPWGPAEKKMVERLVLGPDGKGGYGEEIVRASLKYILVEWQGVKTRYLKGSGVAPSISFLLRCHATLCLEAQRWVGLFKIEREYEEWRKQHPNMLPPSELESRYLPARDELDELRGVKQAVAR